MNASGYGQQRAQAFVILSRSLTSISPAWYDSQAARRIVSSRDRQYCEPTWRHRLHTVCHCAALATSLFERNNLVVGRRLEGLDLLDARYEINRRVTGVLETEQEELDNTKLQRCADGLRFGIDGEYLVHPVGLAVSESCADSHNVGRLRRRECLPGVHQIASLFEQLRAQVRRFGPVLDDVRERRFRDRRRNVVRSAAQSRKALRKPCAVMSRRSSRMNHEKHHVGERCSARRPGNTYGLSPAMPPHA